MYRSSRVVNLLWWRLSPGLFCVGLETAYFDDSLKPGPFGCGLETAQVDCGLRPKFIGGLGPI